MCACAAQANTNPTLKCTSSACADNSHSCACSTGKAIRDSNFRLADPGTSVTQDDKDAWEGAAKKFLGGDGEPADTVQPKRRMQRLSAFYHLCAVDHMIDAVLPGGLKNFIPSEESSFGVCASGAWGLSGWLVNPFQPECGKCMWVLWQVTTTICPPIALLAFTLFSGPTNELIFHSPERPCRVPAITACAGPPKKIALPLGIGWQTQSAFPSCMCTERHTLHTYTVTGGT